MANPATWLLIRGLVREQRHWGEFAMHLSRAFPKDSVLMLDVPGNGERWQETSPWSIAAMVESLRAQLSAADRGRPLRIIGLSMGGMIATAWLQTYPQEIERAVLINSSMRPFSRIDQRLQPRQYWSILNALVAGTERREAIIHGMTVNLHPDRDNTLALWCRIAQEMPVHPLNALRQLIAAARFSAAAKLPPNLPVLILNSLGDRLVDWRCSKAMAERWRCPVFTHPSAGHDLPLDDPHWILTQIQAWLETQLEMPGEVNSSQTSATDRSAI